MTIEHRTTTRQNAKTWGRKFVSRFLEPGLISYEDQGLGKELLTQETIASFVKSFEGKPLIIQHSKTTPENMEEKAVGYISRVYHEPSDGWWYAEGVIHREDGKAAVEGGWSVSCTYQVKGTGPGGKHHNIEYAREITAFEGEHLAIVESPRYENADIRLNEKPKEKPMKLFKLLKDAITGAPAKEIAADSEVTVGEGESVRVKDLVAKWKEKQEADKRENASPSDFVTIDGQKVLLSDLLALRDNAKSEKDEDRENKMVEDLGGRKGLKAKKSRKNEDDEEESEEDDDKEARKNEAPKSEDSRENAAKGENFFQTLHDARENGVPNTSGFVTASGSMSEGLARGAERYGKKV